GAGGVTFASSSAVGVRSAASICAGAGAAGGGRALEPGACRGPGAAALSGTPAVRGRSGRFTGGEGVAGAGAAAFSAPLSVRVGTEGASDRAPAAESPARRGGSSVGAAFAGGDSGVARPEGCGASIGAVRSPRPGSLGTAASRLAVSAAGGASS